MLLLAYNILPKLPFLGHVKHTLRLYRLCQRHHVSTENNALVGQHTKADASNVAHTLGGKDRLAHSHILPVIRFFTGTSVAPTALRGGSLVHFV